MQRHPAKVHNFISQNVKSAKEKVSANGTQTNENFETIAHQMGEHKKKARVLRETWMTSIVGWRSPRATEGQAEWPRAVDQRCARRGQKRHASTTHHARGRRRWIRWSNGIGLELQRERELQEIDPAQRLRTMLGEQVSRGDSKICDQLKDLTGTCRLSVCLSVACLPF